MARTDAHRPAIINPADYAFIGFDHIEGEHWECMKIERERIRAHMAHTGGTHSRHEHGGNCAVCGNVNAISTALFHHVPTNTYVRTGLDCAEKLDGSVDGSEFRRRVVTALEQQKGTRKAHAVLERDGLLAAWAIWEDAPMPGNDDPREETTVRDIVGKLIQYGSISDTQTSYLRKLLSQIARRPEIEAQRAAEREAARPVPITDQRISICGKVLSIRRPGPHDMEFSTRTLVQHPDGWKVWGTLPAALDGVAIGTKVEFSAKVKPSDKDPKFGFFSRPTKARVCEAAAHV